MTVVLALLSLAEKIEQKPVDALSDRLKLDVALAQRDYLLAKAHADQALIDLQVKIAQAEKACGAAKFDAQTIACGPEPQPPK